jgi:hypothetical protein
MIDPTLVSRDALADIDVGISISDSADLPRLGLDSRHAQLAIGEIARAVLVAGGRIVYGGRIKPSGFTQQLMNEMRRYGASRRSLTICLALPEHRKLSSTEFDDIDRQLGTWGRVVTLNGNGTPTSRTDDPATDHDLGVSERVAALSGMRRFVTSATKARVLLGGQLVGFQGAMPGLIEETVLAVEAGQPVYLAGGFGGAAAAAARALGLGPFDWLPADLPAGHDSPAVVEALDLLRGTAAGSRTPRTACSPHRIGPAKSHH